MKTYYVYELVNQSGKIEYIGKTCNPKRRLTQHTKERQNGYNGHGKFFGRKDLTINIVKEFDSNKDALRFEGEHKINKGFEWNERNNKVKLGKRLAQFQIKNKSKEVLVYIHKTNSFVGKFYSISEAIRKLQLNEGNTYSVLKGRANSTLGYRLEYAV